MNIVIYRYNEDITSVCDGNQWILFSRIILLLPHKNRASRARKKLTVNNDNIYDEKIKMQMEFKDVGRML